jgi:pyruvate/2-oxoglutarate dehydrogenase complex dihydrolipoamide dehydrogenase (E3) component
MHYDLAIIGAGSAGLSIAATAAQFGERVVLFEKGEMGGDCLNTGCVPSKALLAASKTPGISFADAMANVHRAITTIAPHDSQERFEGLGVKVVRATAQFINHNTLEAEGENYSARRIIIATGSRAAVPPIPGLKDVPFFTNESIFENHVKPDHLIIIGGGPIGMEMAQAHHRLGSAVTVLDATTPLAKDDPELASVVVQALQHQGITIHTNSKITRIEKTSDGIAVHVEGQGALQGSHLLVAAGRVPNLESLALDKANIAYDKRGISVGANLRSLTNAKVYAAGDVAGGLQFTHVAGYHAGLIIRNALFRLPVKNRTDIIPWVTYTDPELAHVGLSEQQARTAHGDTIRVLKWHFKENDRAIAEGETAGLIKVITAKNGRILGASIVGKGAGDHIAMWTLAITQGLKISAIANMVLPYPTRAEAGKRAATSFYQGLTSKPALRKFIGFLKRLG